MGWLGGSTKVTVATQVSRVIENDRLPNAVRTGTQRSLIGEEGADMVDSIIDETLTSIGVKAHSMYRYAHDHYTWGLPSGEVRTGIAGRDEAQARLELIEGAAVTLNYCHLGSPNALHIAWLAAMDAYGYSSSTNQLAVLSAIKGKPVYLQDLEVVIPEDSVGTWPVGSLDQWGAAAQATVTPWRAAPPPGTVVFPSPVVADSAATDVHVLMTYTWEGAFPGSQLTDTLEIPVDGYDDTFEYFHVKYTVGGAEKYWMYRIGAGTYPELDAVFETPVVMGDFFPFTYFRFDKAAEDPTSDSYLTGKKMAKRLGMDYDQVADAINGNPDIDDVEQALLMLAVPATTTDPLERRYLFDFFDGLYDTANSSPDLSYPWLLGAGKNNITIQDGRFKTVLSNIDIFRETITGSIGPVGTHDSSVGTVNIPTTELRYVDDPGLGTVEVDFPVTAHYYSRQVSSTEYVRIRVLDLKMFYFVWGKYATSTDDVGDVLLVPLDHSITQTYSALEREKLYSRGLYFIFNALVFTHVSWYQSDFFKFLLIVITIILTFNNPEFAALADLIEAGATDLALLLIQEIVINLVVAHIAFKVLARVAGPKTAALIMAAIATYRGFEALAEGSLQGLPFAQELLKLANGLVKAGTVYLESQMDGLSKEYKEFTSLVETKNKELEDANKLLEQSTHLSPFLIIGESPDDFYNRTVHSGNIGTQAISAISSYVDTALTLPKPNQTIGVSYL